MPAAVTECFDHVKFVNKRNSTCKHYLFLKLEGKILDSGNSSFSMNYINIWYCVGAAALAIAGTYIIWGPSSRPKRKKFRCVPGLLNLGNSCFLNAVLQALAACPSSISWLEKIASSANESVLSENYLLIKALLTILKALNSEDDVCSGEHVIEALRSHRWIISNEEQDAHELFHVLTSTIEEELKSANPVLSLLDAGKLEDGSGDDCNTQVPSKSFISSTKSDHSRLASPVCGLLVSELKCNICNSKYPARYDNFDSISLAIPSPHWAHLQDLLMKFISRELVQDVTCDFCTKQKAESAVENTTILKSVFTKQLSFGKLPKCLCIHIQRTLWLKNGVSVKNYEYVAFPEVLIMDYFVHRHMKKNTGIDSNYMQLRLTGGNSLKNEQTTTSKLSDLLSEELVIPSIESQEDVNKTLISIETDKNSKTYKYVYMLKAVIVHLGDTSSGHFITYRRGAMNNQQQSKWYYISDAEVKEVSFTEVSRSCAYMLFYESISDQKEQKL